MGVASPIKTVLTLGKYTLLEKIGEGYLGPVYRGFDQGLDRAVVVRILCAGIKWDSIIEELFNQQCRALEALNHPGIASILDSGKEGQSHFIVMESLGGASLQSLIAQKPAMTAEAKVSIMIQVAEGLGHAHKNGILHRDLAPAKIHMTTDGAAKIRDFAFAHVLRKHLPHPAIRWGAPIYLSPEQVQQQDCDPRSDIFSAGTIFYEMLTYRHPFYDRDGNKALDNILLCTEIPTFEMFPDEPPGVWPILRTCLEKNPKDRYQSMEEFANACRDLLKDLAEDTRLMLAELYAALSPLKAAASQLNASEVTARLLRDIQKLLRGEQQVDYASLDRLMTVLLEQYPVIRAATGALSTTDPADMQPPLEEVQAACADEPSQVPLNAPVAAEASSTAEPSFEGAGVQRNPAPVLPPALAAPAPSAKETDPDNHELMEPSFAEVWDFSPTPQSSSPPPIPEEKSVKKPDAELKPDVAPPAAIVQTLDSGIDILQIPKPAQKPGYRRFPRPSYRTAAALLALLVMATAAYIVWGSKVAASLGTSWNEHIINSHPIANAVAFFRGNKDHGNVSVASADAPKHPDASQIAPAGLTAANNTGPIAPGEIAGGIIIQPPQESISRISSLINSGKLQMAKEELDKLQKAFPGSSRVSALLKQLQAKDVTAIQEKTLREQEQLNAARKQRNDEWNRQVSALFASGKYGEAESILSLWLAEDPGDWNAHEFSAKIGEIQRNLKTYAAAIAENRYQDALNALASAERMNPADSSLTELRRQAEGRKANARASLTVYRLGPKGALFLDGRPISNDGDLENESIPIGSHLLTIENGGSPVVSRRQEFLEGQRIVLVHDLDRQYLRAMVESDRELLSHRKAMEEVRLFEVEHVHGTFRGSCRGTLAVDYLDIAFKPSSGYHGFRMPFKLLKLSINGKSINLVNSTDGDLFQSFKFRDEQAAAKFKQSWDELKAFARQVAENK
jgi:serine/threonine protein kinase